jgi:hypothetical protein
MKKLLLHQKQREKNWSLYTLLADSNSDVSYFIVYFGHKIASQGEATLAVVAFSWKIYSVNHSFSTMKTMLHFIYKFWWQTENI